MKAISVYALLAGFFLGVALESVMPLGVHTALLFVLIACAIFLYRILLQKKVLAIDVKQKSPSNILTALFFLTLFIGAFGLGIFRTVLSTQVSASSVLDIHVGNPISITGVVDAEPDIRDKESRLILSAQGTRMLVTTGLYPRFAYGDKVTLIGTLQKPKAFDTDTGRQFDYPAYLAKDGIYYTLERPKITFISSGNGGALQTKLFAFKKSFIEKIAETIPEPYAPLLSGLLLGGKQSLGKELLDDFRRVGIIHIVVLSGYNITIVGEAIMKLFSFAPRAFGTSFGAGSIILFALMTGGGATVVRASIMALLAVLAGATGRTYDITRALFVAGFLMVLHTPSILIFDPSFQLSFMATLGLVTLSPLIKARLLWVTERFGLRDIVSATFATQIFVLPLLLYNTGQLSLVSLPINLLILPTIPATMLFGFIAGLVAFLGMYLALPFAGVAYALLWYQVALVTFVASFSFASVLVPTISFVGLVCIYIVLVLVARYVFVKSIPGNEFKDLVKEKTHPI
ncbi:ComEC family competence protein [Patescibacteria group bacterium]|nr:MAG: ComEC family competence protein [Patescibacteria group bacterium]